MPNSLSRRVLYLTFWEGNREPALEGAEPGLPHVCQKSALFKPFSDALTNSISISIDTHVILG